MSIPQFETARLTIRPFREDEAAGAWRIADRCFGDGRKAGDAAAIEAFRLFAQWMSLNPRMLAELRQPAYGDLAVVLRESGRVIGQVGYVPCLMPFYQIPELGPSVTPPGFNSPEVGLFWAIDPDHQRQGYAAEAARALIDDAFRAGAWNIARIIATTEYENVASQAVMRKLGMTLTRNPLPTPPWMQVVGVLRNPRAASA
jgi:[ribosomal protein S5]-alanine N-acetyltransferase